MIDVYIDIETQSELDLSVVGTWKYSEHPSTKILCIGYKMPGEEFEQIKADGIGIEDLKLLNERLDIRFVAHNVFFDKTILDKFILGETPISKWKCTKATATYYNLPGSLSDLSRFLKLDSQKDLLGRTNMLKLSKPRKLTKKEILSRGKTLDNYPIDTIEFYTEGSHPELFEKLYDYNKKDVLALEELCNKLPELPAHELETWQLDYEINRRGIPLDEELIKTVVEFNENTKKNLIQDFRKITNNEVSTPDKNKVFLEWLNANGVDIPNLKKDTVSSWINTLNTNQSHIKCLKALRIRQSWAKRSNDKFAKMVDMSPSDSRIRDVLVYARAITNRWAGRQIQTQNLARNSENPDICFNTLAIKDFEYLNMMYRDTSKVYSSCVRSAIKASNGLTFFDGDFSTIEPRVLYNLVGDTEAMNLFREKEDIYVKNCQSVLGYTTKIDKNLRNLGKVAQLAFQYNGGISAVAKFGPSYGFDPESVYDLLLSTATPDVLEKAKNSYATYEKNSDKQDPNFYTLKQGIASDIMKQNWRRNNPTVVNFWRHLEETIINFLEAKTCSKYTWRPGFWDLTFKKQKISNIRVFSIELPSGSAIHYPEPEVIDTETPWGALTKKLSYLGATEKAKNFLRIDTHGGKLTENIVQAISRDILVLTLKKLHGLQYPIVFHIHDEWVCEVPEFYGDTELETFKKNSIPTASWLHNFPIDIEVWRGERYRK